MSLPDGEPAAGPWHAAGIADVVARVLQAVGSPQGRPVVVAVDGRSAAGKSTVAAQVQEHLRSTGVAVAVLHTDDVAWCESYFGWAPRLVDGVLAPLRAGHAVHFQPPAWAANGRAGAIEVPAGVDVVLVEGVGAGQRGLTAFLDAVIWVQADSVLAERRGIARDVELGVNGDPGESVAFWHEWMGQELRFLAEERRWERAFLVVAGTPPIDLAPGDVAIAAGPLTS